MPVRSEVAQYLRRVGVSGRVRVDTETLWRVHRAHLAAIPYENLDIQLGRAVSLDDRALWDKLVRTRRGGFCYEMNGLLAKCLRDIGFTVRLATGAVQRESRGESTWDGHVVLLVKAERRDWVADVGLGDGFAAPLPWRVGTYRRAGFTHRMERLSTQVWRCRPDARGSVGSFDFREIPCGLPFFSARARQLSTAPDSAYVRTLVVQRVLPGELHSLRARTLTVVDSRGRRERQLRDANEFARVLREVFEVDGLGSGEVNSLWAKAVAQHLAWEKSHRNGSLQGPGK